MVDFYCLLMTHHLCLQIHLHGKFRVYYYNFFYSNDSPQHHCVKCPYSEFFWSVFSRNRTEYGEILRISPYLVQMPENTGQKSSEYGHFLRSAFYIFSEAKLGVDCIIFIAGNTLINDVDNIPWIIKMFLLPNQKRFKLQNLLID